MKFAILSLIVIGATSAGVIAINRQRRPGDSFVDALHQNLECFVDDLLEAVASPK